MRAADLSAIEQANALTVQGHQQLDNGDAPAAYKSWTQALAIYRSEKHQEGIDGSLINQSFGSPTVRTVFQCLF